MKIINSALLINKYEIWPSFESLGALNDKKLDLLFHLSLRRKHSFLGFITLDYLALFNRVRYFLIT